MAVQLNRWAVFFFCADARTRQAFKRALFARSAGPATTLRRYYPPFLPAYFGKSFLKPILADLSGLCFYPTLDIPKRIKRRTRQFFRHSVDFAAALRSRSLKITFPSGLGRVFALALPLSAAVLPCRSCFSLQKEVVERANDGKPRHSR